MQFHSPSKFCFQISKFVLDIQSWFEYSYRIRKGHKQQNSLQKKEKLLDFPYHKSKYYKFTRECYSIDKQTYRIEEDEEAHPYIVTEVSQ